MSNGKRHKEYGKGSFVRSKDAKMIPPRKANKTGSEFNKKRLDKYGRPTHTKDGKLILRFRCTTCKN